VQDHLHAAAFVEESLEHDALLRRHGAERAPPVRDVVGDLNRSFRREADLALEGKRVRARLAQVRDLL
jgi:hypothetical protein